MKIVRASIELPEEEPVEREPFKLDQIQEALDDWDWVEIASQAQYVGGLDDVEE